MARGGAPPSACTTRCLRLEEITEMIAGRIFTLRGRAGRLEYISHIVGGVLLYVVTLAITESVLPVLLMFLFVVADEICVAVRRLHDLDRPSSDYWLLLIPI